MTATVTRFVIDALPRTPGQALATPTEGIVAVILIVVLITRGLLAAAATERTQAICRVLDIAAGPLLSTLVFVLYARLEEILPLG